MMAASVEEAAQRLLSLYSCGSFFRSHTAEASACAESHAAVLTVCPGKYSIP